MDCQEIFQTDRYKKLDFLCHNGRWFCIKTDLCDRYSYHEISENKVGKWGVLGSNGAVILEPSLNLDDYLYINFIGDWHKHKDLQLNIYTK